ncbi:MAG: hypothetical protein ACLRSW_01395 [Christensenellaceae bacterium]
MRSGKYSQFSKSGPTVSHLRHRLSLNTTQWVARLNSVTLYSFPPIVGLIDDLSLPDAGDGHREFAYRD